MSDPAVLIAVRKKLSEIPGLPPIVWPNEPIEVSPPFLIFDNGAQSAAPQTVDGVETVELRPQVSAMVEAGSTTTPADLELWAIAQAFKHGTEILSDGGQRLGKMLATPVPDNGQQNGDLFRRNMILRIAHYQQI